MTRRDPSRPGSWWCRIALAVAMSCLCLSAHAATFQAPQYHHTAWSMEDGAPADIWALAQGRDGYLWLGTGTGLYRFDGVQFEQYLPPKDRPFASNNITALYAASDGALWIGFLMGGVSVLRDGQLTHYPAGPGVPSDLLLAFAEDRDGTVWAAARGGFSRFDGQRWQDVGADWGYPGNQAHALLVDPTGTLWVTTGTTLMYLPRGTKRFRPTGEAAGQLASLAQAADGTLWMSDGLHGTRALPDVLDPGRAQPGRTPHALPATGFARFACMRIDRAGVLWGTDRTAGGLMRVSDLQRFRSGRSLRPEDMDAVMRKRDGLLSDRAIPVLRDREDNVWVGTNLGLHRFRYNNVQALQDERLTQHATYGIAHSPEHGLVVSSGRRLYRLRDGVPEQLADSGGAIISAVVVSADGTLWAKTDTSLARFTRGRLEDVPVPGDPAATLSVIVAAEDGGVLVMRDHSGLFHVDGEPIDGEQVDGEQIDGEHARPVGPGIISASHATALARETNGNLWIGYTGNRLARWDGKAQRIYSSRDGLTLGTITAIAPARVGLLVAGETGLVVLRDGRFHPLTVANPQALHGITGIVVSPHGGDIWLNGIRGVVRISDDDLAAAVGLPGREMTARLFDPGDGLLGVAQQYAPSATASADGSGAVWFATSQGLAMIDPARLTSNRIVPPVQIRALTASERRYNPRDGLHLRKGTKSLRLEYTAPSLSVPERVRFRYRLEGVDTDWQEAGTRRSAFYANLRPGQYRFRVIAANDSGLWNQQGDSLDFTIDPLFTQTWWFAALCVLAAGGLLVSLYLMRLRQTAERVRARLQERHDERERIARELHDTLLQSIQGLVLRFQAVANRLAADDPVRTALELALDRADDVITEGRDRVRDLRATMIDSPLDLPEAFAKAGAELAESDPVEFRVVVEGRLPPMDPCKRDEIYWIGREVLINAFRHAHASRIEVEISCGRELLSLRFRDDGKGMAEDVQRNGHKPGHWGLSGMRERARAIPAELSIWSREGHGTEVALVMKVSAVSLSAPRSGWREWIAKVTSR